MRGERGEVKHLSTRRKRYSVSSGERKRIRLNRVRVILGRGCVCGVVGLIFHAAAVVWGSYKCLVYANRLGKRTVESESLVV